MLTGEQDRVPAPQQKQRQTPGSWEPTARPPPPPSTHLNKSSTVTSEVASRSPVRDCR